MYAATEMGCVSLFWLLLMPGVNGMCPVIVQYTAGVAQGGIEWELQDVQPLSESMTVRLLRLCPEIALPEGCATDSQALM